MSILAQNEAVGGKLRTPIRMHNGKVVGEIIGTTLHKTAEAHRNMLQKPTAWALDEMTLYQSLRRGAERVEIRETQFGLTFSTRLILFKERGHNINRGAAGPQVYLYIKHWDCTGEREHIEAFTDWLQREGLCGPRVCRDLRQKWKGETAEQLPLFEAAGVGV